MIKKLKEAIDEGSFFIIYFACVFYFFSFLFFFSLFPFLSFSCLICVDLININVGDKVNFSEFSVHDVSGVTKLYFRELQEPLFTFELYVLFLIFK